MSKDSELETLLRTRQSKEPPPGLGQGIIRAAFQEPPPSPTRMFFNDVVAPFFDLLQPKPLLVLVLVFSLGFIMGFGELGGQKTLGQKANQTDLSAFLYNGGELFYE
jgi:hypothetical protein